MERFEVIEHQLCPLPYSFTNLPLCPSIISSFPRIQGDSKPSLNASARYQELSTLWFFSIFMTFWFQSPPPPHTHNFSQRLPFEILLEGQKWKTSYRVLNTEYKIGKYQEKLQIAVSDGTEREIMLSLPPQGSKDAYMDQIQALSQRYFILELHEKCLLLVFLLQHASDQVLTIETKTSQFSQWRV